MDSIQGILLASLQNRSLAQLRRALANAEPTAEALLADLAYLESLPMQSFFIECARRAEDSDQRRLFVLRYLVNGGGRGAGREFADRLRDFAEASPDEVLMLAAEICLFRCEVRRGETTAVHSFESVLSEIRAMPDSAERDYLLSWALQWCGYAYERSGDFAFSAELLRESIEVADNRQLFNRWSCRTTLGGLQIESGQYRKALATFSNEEWRAESWRQGDVRDLIHSHLMAANAAISLRISAKAIHELNEAKDLLDEHHGQFPHLEAVLILQSARLDTQWGNVDEGIHLFEHAIELFEALDPPFYRGALQAKIELIEFALRDRDYDTVFQRLGELLEEAEQRECIDARTRLLAFHARLFVDDMAPAEELQRGYDDLVTRLHLMNNPRLTFLAYADLYAYARRRLDAREQQFWLLRLKGLRRLLDDSCYHDLYDHYVTERYRSEIESGLLSLDPEFRDDLDSER